MKTKQYWLWWLYFYVFCAVLSFLPEPEGFLWWAMLLIGLAFFVPGVVLVRQADVRDRLNVVKTVKKVSIIALCVDVFLICVNIASPLLSKEWGYVLQWMLNILASPMGCGQSPALTLFGWAFMMCYCIYVEKKER